MKQFRFLLKSALCIAVCACAASCHHLVEDIADGVLSQPEYNAAFTINDEKTEYEYKSLRVFEGPSAIYSNSGNDFSLVLGTAPYYLDTNKALSAFDFDFRLSEEPVAGKAYPLTGDSDGDAVQCAMMWAPLCDRINNPEIAKAHPKERIILVADEVTSGWVKFDKITYPNENIAKMEISFELNATVTGGDNDEVSMLVKVSKGRIKLHNVVKKSIPLPASKPWFDDWKKFVPKDYFMTKLEQGS